MADNAWLLAQLEKLVQRNVTLIQQRLVPTLAEGARRGVRYRRERRGAEEWLDAREVLARGFGDCEDLACWRVAGLRCGGDHDAKAVLKMVRPGLKHVLVRTGRGVLIDPSRALGMGKRP